MKLFRRNPENPNCAWSVRFSVRNKIYPFSTQTTDKALALIRAKDYRNKIVAGEFQMADAQKARGGSPTFAEVFTAYDALPVPEKQTRKRNIASMKAVLAASKLDETARLDKLGSGLAMAYQAKMKGDRPGINAALVSSNTNLRRSRSIFSKHALLAYKGAMAIPLDAVRSYFEVPFLRAAKPLKMLPTEEAMAAAVVALKDHPWHYRAMLLARYGALRAGEILNSRRSWLDGNVLRIGAFPDEYKPKSGAERRVTLPAEVVAILTSGDDPVWLVGPRRREIVAWELNAMLKKAGFTDPKPLHSLRRMALSNVFTTQGAEAAQSVAGHSSIVVTQQAYAHLLKPTEAIAFTG